MEQQGMGDVFLECRCARGPGIFALLAGETRQASGSERASLIHGLKIREH